MKSLPGRGKCPKGGSCLIYYRKSKKVGAELGKEAIQKKKKEIKLRKESKISISFHLEARLCVVNTHDYNSQTSVLHVLRKI